MSVISSHTQVQELGIYFLISYKCAHWSEAGAPGSRVEESTYPQVPVLHKEVDHCRFQLGSSPWRRVGQCSAMSLAQSRGCCTPEGTGCTEEQSMISICMSSPLERQPWEAPLPLWSSAPNLTIHLPLCREVPKVFRWPYKDWSSSTCCLQGRRKTVTSTGKRKYLEE